MSTATIWQALASPYSAAKGVVFINDSLTPDIDVTNFFYTKTTGTLNVPSLLLAATITATVGAVVMNKAAGQVIAAAGATSVVVTNNQTLATSLIIAVAAKADATAAVKSVVAAAGSFTINLTAAATANMPINFAILG